MVFLPIFLSPIKIDSHTASQHSLHKYFCKEQPSTCPWWTCGCMFVLMWECQITTPEWPPIIYISTGRAWGSLYFQQILGINQFPNFWPSESICWVRSCFNLPFSDDKCSYAQWLLGFFFGKLLIRDNHLPVFFSGVLTFFLMICRSSLYNLDIDPLLVPKIADSGSESVIYLFICRCYLLFFFEYRPFVSFLCSLSPALFFYNHVNTLCSSTF